MSGITAAQSAQLFKAFKAGAITLDGDTVQMGRTPKTFRWKGGSMQVGPDLSRHLRDYQRVIRPQRAMEQAWQRAGGAASLVGIPSEGEVSVVRDGDGWLSHFRGGTVRMNAAGTSFEVVERFLVTLAFKALHCVRRTESGNDEVYGSVGIVTNPPGGVTEFAIPTLSFNKSDVRIAEFSHNVQFLRGTSVALSALLMEHDSGDREKIRGKIRGFYDKVETKVRTLTDPLIGEELSEFAVGTLGDVLNVLTLGTFDLLGMGDDRFNPASRLISWEEFFGNPPKSTYSHRPDPRSGTFTHKLDVSYPGGGGHYACYFDFRVDHETNLRPLN